MRVALLEGTPAEIKDALRDFFQGKEAPESSNCKCAGGRSTKVGGPSCKGSDPYECTSGLKQRIEDITDIQPTKAQNEVEGTESTTFTQQARERKDSILVEHIEHTASADKGKENLEDKVPSEGWFKDKSQEDEGTKKDQESSEEGQKEEATDQVEQKQAGQDTENEMFECKFSKKTKKESAHTDTQTPIIPRPRDRIARSTPSMRSRSKSQVQEHQQKVPETSSRSRSGSPPQEDHQKARLKAMGQKAWPKQEGHPEAKASRPPYLTATWWETKRRR